MENNKFPFPNLIFLDDNNEETIPAISMLVKIIHLMLKNTDVYQIKLLENYFITYTWVKCSLKSSDWQQTSFTKFVK